MNLDLFYDVPITKIDKTKPYYNPTSNRIYIRGIPSNWKYYTEVDNNGEMIYIISQNKIHSQSRRIRIDAFGRCIIIPIAFKDYLRSKADKEVNVDIIIEPVGECVAMKLCV